MAESDEKKKEKKKLKKAMAYSLGREKKKGKSFKTLAAMTESEEGRRRRRRRKKAMAGRSFDPYDRISQLPDCILTWSIISYLPIKECARTSVLSSRWRYLWRFSPLDIDASSLRRERETQTLDATSLKRKKTLGEADEIIWRVDAIISRHRGPIRSLHLSKTICRCLPANTGDRWINVLDRKGIQNLTFYGELPTLFYTCHSLRSLELIDGCFPWVNSFPMTPLLPPNLRELRLRLTLITNPSLSHILSSCRLLNTLVLDRCMNIAVGITHISSPCLRELTIAGDVAICFYTGSLFYRCHSLRTLELIYQYILLVDYTFPMTPLPPNLRELRLSSATITETNLSHILSSCRLLNTLVLNGCTYCPGITHISFPCLRELTITGAFHGNAALSIEEAPNLEISMWIEDTPNLEILMLDEIFTERMPLKVVNAPKLRQLGVVNANVRMLEFGHTRFQRKLPINLDTRMHSLTTLTTRVDFSDAYQAKILAGLLTCFPCLETLNILNDGSGSLDPVDSQYWEQKDSFACLDCHLKFVKIKGFLGDEYDLGFAKFLVKNARALMMISLLCLADNYLMEIEEEARLHEFGYENRASLDVRVVFLMD